MPVSMPTPTSNASLCDLTIESIGGLGDGIAGWRGVPVFVPKTCAGDRILARITRRQKDSAEALLHEVISPGPDRVAPPCKHYDTCGGCSLQHIREDAYRAFKTRVLRQSLAHGGCPAPEAEVVFLPPALRRRAEFKLHREGGAYKLAFLSARSHQRVPIDECLVLAPELQALLGPLPEAIGHLPFAAALEAISVTLTDSGADLILMSENHITSGDISALNGLGLARVCLQTQGQGTRILRGSATITLAGAMLELPPGAFLQASEQSAQWLTDAVCDAASGASRAADLFCGIGTYSLPLSRSSDVLAIEGDEAMVRALAQVAPPSLSCHARDLFRQPLSSRELAGRDVVVINPPRAGARAQTEQLAASGVQRIVMVSCNPATFSRDARLLVNAGYRLSHASGLDQFTYSAHLEIFAVFDK